MVLNPTNSATGLVLYLLAMTGISFSGTKLLWVVVDQTIVLAQPYLDNGPPKLPLTEQRRIDATLSIPPLPQQERERIAALEIPALPANVLATRLDSAERGDLTEPASTHIASAAGALQPSSQPSSITARVYSYRVTKLRALHSSSRYAAVTARDVFNQEFGVLSLADNEAPP